MKSTQHLFLILSALLLVAGSYQYLFQPVPVALTTDLSNFPSEIGDWTERGTAGDDSAFIKLGADNELSRTYRNANGETVQLYIGYFSYQDQEKKLVSYKTAGFERNASRKTIAVNHDHMVEINRALREEGGQMKQIYFWYDLDGQTVANPMLVKAYTAWNALTKRRTNGAVVILTADLLNEKNSSGDPRRDELLVQTVWPYLEAYLPRS